MLTNAKDMLDLLRDNIGEATPAQWTNLNLLRRLNMAYLDVARVVADSSGQWLLKSTSLTAVDSVLTLPIDCAKPAYLEDEDGNPVSWLNSVGQRRVSRGFGVTLDTLDYQEAYPLMNTIEINKSGDTGVFTLWYQQKIYELHTGTAAAGAATSLTLEASLGADIRNDYYNGALIEVVSGTGPGRYTISDYVGSTRVCTLDSGTFGADSVYGIVPVTPYECNDLIVLQATLLALSKPSSILDEKVLQMFINLESRTRKGIKEWLGSRLIENTGITITEPIL